MFLKTTIDYILALILLIILVGLIICMVIIATVDTKEFGLFFQERVGKNGILFRIYKIRTMKGIQTDSITTDSHKITKIGSFFRKYKLDEVPQLVNILKGEMSFVGPRPDVIGYADQLVGEDRLVLSIKPGITGPAQLKYKDEEVLLSSVKDPIWYNDYIIWPDKVKINKEYIKNWSLKTDFLYLFKTIFK